MRKKSQTPQKPKNNMPKKVPPSPPIFFPYKVDMNEDALEYLKLVEQNKTEYDKNIKRRNDKCIQFQRDAQLEEKVRKRKLKMKTALNRIHELEKNKELENLNNQSGSHKLQNAYMSHAKYFREQDELAQIFLDDHARPRNTIPVPTKYDDNTPLHSTPPVSDDE